MMGGEARVLEMAETFTKAAKPVFTEMLKKAKMDVTKVGQQTQITSSYKTLLSKNSMRKEESE